MEGYFQEKFKLRFAGEEYEFDFLCYKYCNWIYGLNLFYLMGNNQDKFQYSHNIEYDIEFSHEDINLTIELRVEGSKGKKYYKQTFAYDELPLKLQEHFESSQKLYELFGKEDNFVVDPLNGMIYIRVKEEKSDTKI